MSIPYRWMLLSALLVTAAQAGETRYTSRTAFDQAAATLPQLNFNFDPASGFPTAPASIDSLDAGQIRVRSTSGFLEILVPGTLQLYPAASTNQVLTGATQTPGLASEMLSLGFNRPAYGIAFEIVDLNSPDEEALIRIRGLDGLMTAYTLQDDDANPATPLFFGLIRDNPIQYAAIVADNPLIVPPFPGFTPNGIDNLAVVIPEPTLPLFALIPLALTLRRSPPHHEHPSPHNHARRPPILFSPIPPFPDSPSHSPCRPHPPPPPLLPPRLPGRVPH